MADPKRRLTPGEWAKAESLYESGEFNLEQIAEEFGVHPITVQRHMKANGIEKGSKAAEIKEKVTEKMKDAAEEDASIIAQRIRETKEEHYRLNQAIDKRIVREMVGVESEGRSIATSLGVFKALKTAAETLKLTRENRYTVLGIIDNDTLDDELPTLEVRDMLEEEIESIREQQRLQAEEMGLTTDEGYDDDALEGAE
ncbi:TPA: hypothetical protein ACGR4R_003111 [Aeromonas veronii]|uniref:Uncharacterized protein n=1 Tax=Aeromonas veronii TaxID=654 RepID=A0AAX2UP61_AERVE|nr:MULTISPECIES: hypothetical protein [Aeromonas]MBS4705222.1 hypothetical protein [Aeromonas veronii]MCF5728949.1 hypothetical protein [Aeromonas veronii]MDM5056544.1 hypothetical protein [Aeromonas dhakensis]MDM5082701.1 hypothetical protein [Aeromonas dhakensis]QWL60593.1 hypothetical protein HQ400_21200 [Aeromonas jandaei]